MLTFADRLGRHGHLDRGWQTYDENIEGANGLEKRYETDDEVQNTAILHSDTLLETDNMYNTCGAAIANKNLRFLVYLFVKKTFF